MGVTPLGSKLTTTITCTPITLNGMWLGVDLQIDIKKDMCRVSMFVITPSLSVRNLNHIVGITNSTFNFGCYFS
jgi:hypothetical protein